ncbi:very short patch repair endonuclease [Microbacterium thalassium]|uniref:DNA mismatch endonuclease (Patch repair protein) n=1 Tax=Microbacterium thalassium TaxID=362649 RepID=A0A7X0KVY2_9MICO|nr:very short patch repair endonuclease [Microbacterium thalassium]MBB6392715.1 DNA mismatch endonuclease (patch repair protein) [Microbacterium thalassium]
MADSWASSETSRRTMVANRRRDTQPEMRVRRILHAAGLRYIVDARPITSSRSRADIVFTKRRIAVFIDGCFWHRCPVHGTTPKANSDYWTPKLERNVKRDQEVTQSLMAAGWTVLRFWEHEDPTTVAAEIIGVWHAANMAESQTRAGNTPDPLVR